MIYRLLALCKIVKGVIVKVEFYLSIGLAGAARTDTVEVPDDYSEEEIEEEYQAWKNDYIEGYWNKLSEVQDDNN